MAKIVIVFLILINLFLTQDNLLVKLKEKTINKLANQAIKSFVKLPLLILEKKAFEKKVGIININGDIENFKLNKLENLNFKINDNILKISINKIGGEFGLNLNLIFNIKGLIKINLEKINIDVKLSKDKNSNIIFDISNIAYEKIDFNISNNSLSKVWNFLINHSFNNFLAKLIVSHFIQTDFKYQLKNVKIPFKQSFIDYILTVGDYFNIKNNQLYVSLKVDIYNFLFKKYVKYDTENNLDINLISKNSSNGLFIGNKILSQFIYGFLKVYQGIIDKIDTNVLKNYFPNINKETNNSQIHVKYQINATRDIIKMDSNNANYKKFLFLNNSVIFKNEISLKFLGNYKNFLNYDFCQLKIKNTLDLNINSNNGSINYDKLKLSKVLVDSSDCNLSLKKDIFNNFLTKYISNINGEINYKKLLERFKIDIDINEFNLNENNLLILFN